MSLTVTTKVLSATDNLGTRIKANYVGFKEYSGATIPYPHDLCPAQAHLSVFKKLIEMNHFDVSIKSKWVMGETNEGYVFVSIHDSEDNIIST